MTELRKPDRQTRKLLTMHGAVHCKADIDRLYRSRREGGRGLLNIETIHTITTEGSQTNQKRS